jgi:hypothetical protein
MEKRKKKESGKMLIQNEKLDRKSGKMKVRSVANDIKSLEGSLT